MQTGKKINQISNRLRRRSRAIQETIGISGAQGNILNYILVESQNRSVYQKDIEQEFGLRPSTATETLKSLEKNGLIKRETDPNDGRVGNDFAAGSDKRRTAGISADSRENVAESGYFSCEYGKEKRRQKKTARRTDR